MRRDAQTVGGERTLNKDRSRIPGFDIPAKRIEYLTDDNLRELVARLCGAGAAGRLSDGRAMGRCPDCSRWRPRRFCSGCYALHSARRNKAAAVEATGAIDLDGPFAANWDFMAAPASELGRTPRAGTGAGTTRGAALLARTGAGLGRTFRPGGRSGAERPFASMGRRPPAQEPTRSVNRGTHLLRAGA